MASKIKWIVVVLVVVAAGAIGYQYWKSTQSALPAGIVSGNGRIEANLMDASAKEPLRVKEVLVNEGDLVKPEQLLVRLDTATIDAELAKNQAGVSAAREQVVAANSAIATAMADVAAAKAEIASAKAAIAQEESQIRLAQIEVERERKMLADRATSQRAFDVRQTNLETTKATLASAQAREAAAQARVVAAQARADTSRAQADAARQQIEVAQAEVARTQSRIQDAVLLSPVAGRVLYRLAEPGEVLGPGGKALTIVDLSDVYMEIFLPAEQAGAVKVGSEARITVDSEPDRAVAARVSFVSPEAQFTPKQVETRSEREKLMFRVKIQVPAELVQHYVERIKTGMRGVGYVKLSDDAKFPEWLERGLVNPPKASDASQTPR